MYIIDIKIKIFIGKQKIFIEGFFIFRFAVLVESIQMPKVECMISQTKEEWV